MVSPAAPGARVDDGSPADRGAAWVTAITVVVALALVAGAFAGMSAAVAAGGDAVRIMFVGDSITQGGPGDYTWRYWMWEHLRDQHVDAEGVGPTTLLFDHSEDYMDPGFPREHDAWGGRTLSFAATFIEEDTRAFDPDVLLVLMGTNDVGSDGWTPDSVADFVVAARAAEPQLRFVFGEIPPTCIDGFEAKRVRANVQLRDTAEGLSTAESPIVVVTAGDFDPWYDTHDCVHPSPSGERRIAAAFSTGLASLGIMTAVPYEQASVPWPAAPTRLTAAASDDAVRVSWTATPGAPCYNVYAQTTGPDWSRQEDCLEAGAADTVSATLSAQVSAVRVTARKGSFEGPAVEARVPVDAPTDLPSPVPSDVPSAVPSDVASDVPSAVPSDVPSAVPSDLPSPAPSGAPNGVPSDAPSAVPGFGVGDAPPPAADPVADPAADPADLDAGSLGPPERVRDVRAVSRGRTIVIRWTRCTADAEIRYVVAARRAGHRRWTRIATTAMDVSQRAWATRAGRYAVRVRAVSTGGAGRWSMPAWVRVHQVTG